MVRVCLTVKLRSMNQETKATTTRPACDCFITIVNTVAKDHRDGKRFGSLERTIIKLLGKIVI